MLPSDQEFSSTTNLNDQSESLTKLDYILSYATDKILKAQTPILGFLKNEHRKEHAFLRDSLYGAYALYITSVALRNHPKSQVFRLAATKAMRAAMMALMRQSKLVHAFKVSQEIQNSVKTVFDARTGDVADVPENDMLLMDDVAMFVMFLCQLTTANLRIVYNKNDVDFIQNLVYYLERAYRVPDNGPHKNFTQRRTLHASTIGFAKAALEAAHQCNLFGNSGTHTTRLHVDPDAHNRNRMTINSILPRQSAFEQTDASLVFVVGWPCFAVEDEKLVEETLDKCTHARNFMLHREYAAALDITEYLLGKKLYDRSTCEFNQPGWARRSSQQITSLRYHSFSLISYIVTNGLVTNSELDPCRRFVPRLEQNAPISMRFNHQSVIIDTVLISESNNVTNLLKTYGIRAQTPEQVYPVEIWSCKKLLEAYESVGQNERLGFTSGRPLRPFGSLGTSRVYRIINGDTSKLVIPYALTFDSSDFYMTEDSLLMIDRIWTTLNFLTMYWKENINPVFILLVKDEVLFSKKFMQKSTSSASVSQFLSMLSHIKAGYWHGVRTKITTISEHVNHVEAPVCLDVSHRNVASQYGRRLSSHGDMKRSLSQISLKSAHEEEPPMSDEIRPSYEEVLRDFDYEIPDSELISALENAKTKSREEYLGYLIAVKRSNRTLWGRYDKSEIKFEIEREIHYSAQKYQWNLVRRASGELRKYIDSLAPSVTAVLSIGIKYIQLNPNTKLLEPEKPDKIIRGLYDESENTALVGLKQEILVHFGRLASLNKTLLADIYCLKLGEIVKGLTMLSKRRLEVCSPGEVKYWLLRALAITTGVEVSIPPWLLIRRFPRGSGSKPDCLADAEEVLSERGGMKTLLRHYLCMFPLRFEERLEYLNDVLPDGIWVYDEKLTTIADFVAIGELEKRQNLISLVMKIAKFISESPLPITASLNFGDFLDQMEEQKELMDGDENVDIVRMLLKKVFLESDRTMKNLSECFAS